MYKKHFGPLVKTHNLLVARNLQPICSLYIIKKYIITNLVIINNITPGDKLRQLYILWCSNND